MQRFTLFLDDGGVMNDNRVRGPQWRHLLGEFFPPLLGGTPGEWAEANRALTEGLWAPGGPWPAYSGDLWRRGGSTYAGFNRAYQIDWLWGMCEIIGLPPPPADEALDLAERASHFVTRRVRSALPGAAEAIRDLNASGYRLHTASGERSVELEGYLAGMGVRQCFGRLYGPDLVDVLKEGPVYYQRILADAGVDAADAVFVDDSPAAVQWAMEAGARAILIGAVLPGAAPPTTVVASLAGLPAALAGGRVRPSGSGRS